MVRFAERFLPLAVFALAFSLGPLRLYDGLNLIPGDVGDARLNNYFLENVYQFFAGRVPSLWHLTFFYPFPWIIGFSDNLFGSAPVYMLARAAGAAPDSAFQIWFLFGYGANFAAAYYAMRRLDGSPPAAALGAVIFAFGLPTMAHAGHAQLHYRFGIPLALLFFAEFLERQTWRALISALAWLTWQFYCGIYMGFFALLMMGLMVPVHVISSVRGSFEKTLRAQVSALADDWNARSRGVRIGHIFGFCGFLALLVLLFYPYLKAKDIYDLSRSWAETSTMLPRPQSYLLSDGSTLWSPSGNKLFESLPMRHEHQMFVGLMPLLLALAGFATALRTGFPHVIRLLAGSMALMIIITINVGGESLWYLFHWLPLASAIRAMTRFDQVLLFPVGVLAMMAIDSLRYRVSPNLARFMWAIVILACILEMALHRSYSSDKAQWRARIAAAEAALPTYLPADAVLFMSQLRGPFFAAELDAMWVALRHGIPTMNGYSGNLPFGATMEFGTDCIEMSRRIAGYQALVPTAQPDKQFRELANRVVLVGFDACDLDIMRQAISMSQSYSPYSPQEVLNLSYRITDIDPKKDTAVVTIASTANFAFAALSRVGQPLRLSWRYLDRTGTPLSGWDNRKELPGDIPAKGEVDVVLPLQIPDGAASLEVSMVQEGLFWFHDLGIPPASVPLP